MSETALAKNGRHAVMNVDNLRKAAICVHIAVDAEVAADIEKRFIWVADEIERLRKAIDRAGALACQNAPAETIRSSLAEAKNW